MIQTKYKVILVAVAIITAAAFGRWTAPVKTVVQIKTVETVKTVTVKDTDKNQDTTVTEVKKPDGTVTTVTHTTTETKTDTKTQTAEKEQTDTTKTTTKSTSTLTLSALAGVNVTNPAQGMIYGGLISKQVLGPVSIGLFGLSNGTAGASVSLTF